MPPSDRSVVPIGPGRRRPGPADRSTTQGGSIVSNATADLARLLVEVDDLRAQVARLAGQPVEQRDRPALDQFGVLTFGNGWVPLSPLEETIVRRLLDSFGTTVARD